MRKTSSGAAGVKQMREVPRSIPSPVTWGLRMTPEVDSIACAADPYNARILWL